MKIAQGELHREAKRVFRRLVEPETYLSSIGQNLYGLFVPRNRGAKPVMKVERSLVEAFSREGWLKESLYTDGASSRGGGYMLSEVGLAWWSRQRAELGAEPFQRQHQGVGIMTGGKGKINFAESPLAWLHHRKGRDGKAFLNDAEFEAGERFRVDFTKAKLSPSLTANWEVQSISRAKRSHAGGLALDATHKAMMARKRFDRAFEAVGVGLQDVLIEVCCHLHGLEGVEQSMHWPQRSGKVVLRIALGRLVQHYEMKGPEA